MCDYTTKKRSHEKNDAQFVGHTFSRLQVLAFADVHKRQRRYWCHCDCGNFCRVTGSNLKAGRVQSCGCLRREVVHDQAYRMGRATKPRKPAFNGGALWTVW